MTLELAAEAQSAARARRFVDRELGTRCSADVVEIARLLVTELVTNAVLHAGTPLLLRLELSARRVRIEVQDASPSLPVACAVSPDASHGRGLGLVDRLASEWGVERQPGGKAVWLELARS